MTSKDEYIMLRSETMEIYNIVNSTRSILYLFVSGIISYSFVNDKLGLLLIPYIVIIPMYLVAIDYTRDMYRIGTYLQVFHEGEAFNWETRQYQINFNTKNKMPRFPKIFHISYLITNVTCYICVIYKISDGNINIFEYLKNTSFDTKYFYFIIASIELLIVLIIYLIFNNMLKIQNDYLEAWTELKVIEFGKNITNRLD